MKPHRSFRLPRLVTTVLTVALSLDPAVALAADNVMSRNVKEADGTSGQDTELGSGIKTGHIQDGAITTAKIAAEAVTDAKIEGVSMNKVTGLDAALASKADTSALDELSGAVAGKADQSALDDLGAVVAAKADQGVVDGLNAALADKAAQSDLDALDARVTDLVRNPRGPAYGNMTVVATSGGDYSSPVDALEEFELGSWCGSPSVDNPCMVKIMPGIYDIGTGTIVMRSYVDIEGSGSNVTILRKPPQVGVSDTAISTTGARNSEIRSVTVERAGEGGAAVTAISGTGNAISIRDSSIVVDNGPNGAAEAVVNKYGMISLLGVDIDSSQIGIRFEDNDLVEISDSRIAANAAYAGAYLQGRVNDYASVQNTVFDNRRTGSFTRGLHIIWYPIPAATNGNEYKVDLEDTSVYGYRIGVLAVNGVNLSMRDVSITSAMDAMELSSGVTRVSSSVITGRTRLRFGAAVRFARSEINGQFTIEDGVATCFGTHDANLDPVTCP